MLFVALKGIVGKYVILFLIYETSLKRVAHLNIVLKDESSCIANVHSLTKDQKCQAKSYNIKLKI